jgi:DNA repair photolyase
VQTLDFAHGEGLEKIIETKARSILVRSRLPDSDYVVNPYTGCTHACAYCYASFMGRFVNRGLNEWGEYLYVKTNAVEIFEKELKRMPLGLRNSSIFISSVTDPYQAAELKYRLTRGILEALERERYPGEVGILTKSNIVLRDVDLFKSLPNCEVGMTITTTDDALSRLLEARAPSASVRLDALRKMHESGVRTYAFIGPLLPHLKDKPKLLEKLFADVASAGVETVYVEHMNLKPYIKERLWKIVEKEPAEVREAYKEAESEEYRRELEQIVKEFLNKYNLRLRLGEVLYHEKFMKEKAWK